MQEKLSAVAIEGRVPLERIHGAEVAGFEGAVNGILNSGVISSAQESQLASFMKATNLGQEDLNGNGTWTRMVQGCVLSDIARGNFKTRVNAGALPFNFQKGEVLLWVFNACQYGAEKTHRSYLGARAASVSG